ncbi:MAG TPA: hypothetical protein VN375_19265 [Vicinamibacteria bacterium]|jgi:hypothetical protein|nr:hypothetical protein [Vicinamibacteria bacterium]
MSVQKDPRSGRFYSVPVTVEPGDETFVRITNEDIYHEVKSIAHRVEAIEGRLSRSSRLYALIIPTVTCLTGVVTAAWYLKH